MPNTELLVDVLAHIELDPASWRQSDWLQLTGLVRLTPETTERLADETYVTLTAEDVHGCGTAGCLAGWACLLGGAVPEWTLPILTKTESKHGRLPADAVTLLGVAAAPGGALFSVEQVALDLLGLDSPILLGDPDEYGDPMILGELFDAENDLDDLYRIGAALFGLTEPELRERVAAKVAQQAVTA